MSILLILCVLAAAGWLVLSVRGRGPGDDPGDTVAAYSRAMAALDPTDSRASRQRRRSAPARSSRASTGSSRRPARHRSAHRARPSAARSRAVRR